MHKTQSDQLLLTRRCIFFYFSNLCTFLLWKKIADISKQIDNLVTSTAQQLEDEGKTLLEAYHCRMELFSEEENDLKKTIEALKTEYKIKLGECRMIRLKFVWMEFWIFIFVFFFILYRTFKTKNLDRLSEIIINIVCIIEHHHHHQHHHLHHSSLQRYF